MLVTWKEKNCFLYLFFLLSFFLFGVGVVRDKYFVLKKSGIKVFAIIRESKSYCKLGKWNMKKQ